MQGEDVPRYEDNDQDQRHEEEQEEQEEGSFRPLVDVEPAPAVGLVKVENVMETDMVVGGSIASFASCDSFGSWFSFVWRA